MYIYITIYFPQNWGKAKNKQKKRGETNKYWVYQFRMMELKIVKYQKEEQQNQSVSTIILSSEEKEPFKESNF